MSHYCVAVFTRSGDMWEVEQLLEKYDERPANPELFDWMEKDEEGYYFNPNAKWDWWTIGGRWHNDLKNKNGIGVDTIKVSEAFFGVDPIEYKKAERFWDVVVNHCMLQPGERESDFETHYNAKYYKDQYRTKEFYAKMQASFVPWAFVTMEEGDWFENGQMGWLGTHDGDNEKRTTFYDDWQMYLRKAIDEDLYITIVDCHI